TSRFICSCGGIYEANCALSGSRSMAKVTATRLVWSHELATLTRTGVNEPLQTAPARSRSTCTQPNSMLAEATLLAATTASAPRKWRYLMGHLLDVLPGPQAECQARALRLFFSP